MHGIDHAARDQQGDVRRMSLFTSLRDSAGARRRRGDRAPTACRRASLEWRGGQPVVSAHASSRCPTARSSPSLTAANIARSRGGRRPRSAACSNASAGPRRIGLVVPDAVAKVSLVRFEQVPAARAGSRPAGALAGPEGGAVPDRGGAGQLRAGAARRRTARNSSSRWRGATSIQEYEQLCADAGAHAGLVDLATFNVINAVLAGSGAPTRRLAAGERRRRLRVDRDPARPAPDLLPQPRRRHRRHARRSRPPDGDVLRGSAEGRAASRASLLAGAASGGARQAATSSSCAAASRSGCGTPVETVDPRAAATLTDRIAAAPALLDTLAPLVGLLLRDRAGGDGVIRTNLSTRPFYNERAVHIWLLAAGRGRGGRDGCSTSSRVLALLAQRHASWRRRRRATRRAPPTARSRPRACAPASIRGRSSSPSPTRARPTT